MSPLSPIPPPQPGSSWQCADCTKIVVMKGSRMPAGWKRLEEKYYCRACWQKRYILRAVTLPIARPLDMDWVAFRTLLQSMWAASTQASNWILTEMYAADTRRLDQAKLPAMPKTYFYPALRRRFPILAPQSVTAIEKAVKAKYMSKRKEVVWQSSASLPTFRYPTPLPVSNQAWSVENDGTVPVVTARIGETNTRLKLQSGKRFVYQTAALAKIISGVAIPGELAIYRHDKDVLCKMVAWLPRTAAVSERTGTLTIRATADSLSVAYNVKDEKIWVYNGDQLRRWVAEHRKQLERWSQDSKAEHRPVPPFAERRQNAAEKYHRRMKHACHAIAAMVVNYAVRRKFQAIFYDDSDHSFLPEFPWFDLAQKIGEKADAAQLEFVHSASSEAIKEEPEPLDS